MPSIIQHRRRSISRYTYKTTLCLIAYFVYFTLSGCAETPKNSIQNSVNTINISSPEELVNLLRNQYQADQQNFSLLIRLREAEQAAVDYYLSQGERQKESGDTDEALSSFKVGLRIRPNSHPLLVAKEQMENAQKLSLLVSSASDHFDKGMMKEAKVLLESAIAINANDQNAINLYTKVQNAIRGTKNTQHLIDLNFEDLEFKKAITFIAKSYGISVVFDEGIRDSELTIDLKSIPFSQAIKLVTEITRNTYKVVNHDTLLIFPDNVERRRQYDDIAIRTFILETMTAKDMGVLLKSALGIKNLTINEANNAIILRETTELIDLAEQIIRANDVSPGEVVLNVEILEINLTEAEKLGIDYGNYQISSLTTAVPTIGSISNSIMNATNLSIPSVNLNAFKQAVDAKMLAKPSVRVLDGQKAKIHIGDRVPLRQSSIQDATGQTRTTFEYQEIGIRFNVEAKIHPNDQVTVQVGLEVSALGENLGTATEQAFRIGTRNADTTMLVRDGETAILGGLLREEGRSTTSGIKGLSSVDILKKIFGSEDISKGRTDLLLTITPNIIRRSEGFRSNQRYIDAGTEANMKDHSKGDQLDQLILKPPSSDETAISTEREHYKLVINDLKNEAEEDTSISSDVRENSINTSDGIELKFDKPEYRGKVGDVQQISIQLTNPTQLRDAEIVISLNPNILTLGKIEPSEKSISIAQDATAPGDGFRILLHDASNELLALEKIVTFEVQAKRKGTSFLTLDIVQTPTPNEGSSKARGNNSRFIVN